MWFTGSLMLVFALAIVSGLLGRALFAFARPLRGLSGLCMEQIAGAGILMLSAGWITKLGLAMNPWGALAALGMTGCAVLALRRDPRAADTGHGALAPLTLLGGLAAGLALLSLMRDNAFNPYGDAIPSMSLGEFLQTHPFSRDVTPALQSPVAGIVALYQHAGYRMGVHYLLALVQACVPHARSIDIFPAVSAYGVALVGASGYLAARRLAGAPHSAALAAALVGTGGFSLAKYAADYGIMNQLFGIALMIACLAELCALTAPRRAGSLRRWLPLAICAAALSSAYSELIPICGLAVLLVLAVRAPGLLRDPRRFAGMLAVCALVAAALSNTELRRAWLSLVIQTRNQGVGSHIPFSFPQFMGSWLGLSPGPSDAGYLTEAKLPGALMHFYRFVHGAGLLLAALGLLRVLRKRSWRARAGLLAALAVFAGLYVHFAFFQANPFMPGTPGNSWALSKLTMYAAPLGTALIGAAAAWVPAIARWRIALALAVILPFLPAHDRLSLRRTELARLMTGDRRAPFSQYAALPAAVNRLAGAGPVRLRIPPGTPCFHYELAAYYLYPRPLASDHWRDSLCMYLGPYEGMGFTSPAGPYALTIAPADEPIATGQTLPAGFRVVEDFDRLRVDFAGGWNAREYGTEGWWHWSTGRGVFKITSRAGGRLVVRARIGCVQPRAQLHWRAGEAAPATTECRGEVVTSPDLPLAAGVNEVTLTALAPGADAPAPFLLRNLEIVVAPGDSPAP